MTSIRQRIGELSRQEGFDLASITTIRTPNDAPRFVEWLENGMNGEMKYLERFRERIVNPLLVKAGCKSVISLAVNHSRPPGGFAEGGRVARYALGRDYHNVIQSMTKKLILRLRSEGIGTIYRDVTDAGPVLERSFAAMSGIGFLSKSANLLHYKYGPWLFLSEIFIDITVDDAPERAPGSCGTCTKCIELCPTGAIVAPGSVDARICISYLTIEYRGIIEDSLKSKIGDWVFGCDVCSEVCPFGDGAPNASNRFGRHAALDLRLEDLLTIDETQFKQQFAGSPMRRAKRAGIARNAAIVLGNLKRRGAAKILQNAARDDSAPEVRDAAAWALSRI
ncbi:MAG: tRNA epoxyqueuosine(34) reductase QueG [Planctomycetota bacterium]